MVTRKIAIGQILELVRGLTKLGYRPTQAYLFGSVAKGSQHEWSDIDLALWDERFSGVLHLDYVPIARLLTQFPRIELHTFSSGEDEFSNPFIGEIKKTGVEVDLSEILQQEEALTA